MFIVKRMWWGDMVTLDVLYYKFIFLTDYQLIWSDE